MNINNIYDMKKGLEPVCKYIEDNLSVMKLRKYEVPDSVEREMKDLYFSTNAMFAKLLNEKEFNRSEFDLSFDEAERAITELIRMARKFESLPPQWKNRIETTSDKLHEFKSEYDYLKVA